MKTQDKKKINLKETILQVLALKKYTYSDLTEHLGVSELELDSALENNTLELRTLERISKVLHLPLYSFFRENLESIDFKKDSTYTEHISLQQETQSANQVQLLQQEIEMLRAEVHRQNLLLEALESQLKGE